ncbi:MAG: histidine kinase [Flavobacteriales bacterium]|nr:histidine kinase [Flavobacteriales bacterium]
MRLTLLLVLLLPLAGFAQQDSIVVRLDESGEWSDVFLPSDSTITFQGNNGAIEIGRRKADGSTERVSTIHVESQKSIWSQPWFVVCTIALLAFGLSLLFWFFLNRSRNEALLRAQVSELERSALQAQMNPHFIFNSLNSIQSYIANNENDKANRFLAKFSRLIRAMLNNSRSSKIKLQDEIDSLTLYLELEKMRFKEKFDFEIIVDEECETSEIKLPPLLIQPYLENAIIHGLAQTRSRGKIDLYYILDGKYLLATVTDNGIGIEQSKKQKAGKESLHKSVGMTITQKRLEILDEGNADKKVSIEEIKDRHGEVLGTKVEVKIRVK